MKQHSRLITFVFTITIALLSACSTAPEKPLSLDRGDYSYVRDHLSWLIKDKMVEHDVVGLSIALVDDQRVIWSEGFGWADEKRHIKATPETVYRAGSITKLFTATAAMQLAEQGKMPINQPLQHYLPGFSINSRFEDAGPITPRNIMTHHSGLPSDYLHGMWTEEPASFTQLVDQIKNDYTAYPPDTILSYSNLAMTLLGNAVQEVDGRPYDEYVRQSLLMPLGMSDSYIAPGLREGPRTARGYYENEERTAVPLRDLPAGALNSTVLDLARFTQMVFAGGQAGGQQILKQETLKEMLRYQDGDAPFDLQRTVGLGWFLDDRFGNEAGPIAYHDGATFLYNSSLMALPTHKLAVVVMTNSASAGKIVNDISREALRLALEAKTGIVIADEKELSDRVLPLRAEDLKVMPGDYSTQLGLVHIKPARNGFIVEADDENLDLVLREDGYYHLQYKLLGLFPVGLGRLEELGIRQGKVAGCDLLLANLEGRKLIAGERIKPAELPASWQARLGAYEVINPQDVLIIEDVELSDEGGLFTLEFSMRMSHLTNEDSNETIALAAVAKDEAVVHGLGRGKGGTVRVVYRNGEELLSYSGFLFRRTH